MNSDIVEIFWTGGYDSTFRICQLSRENVIVSPYYLSDKRKSEAYELGAIKKITDKIRQDKNTKAVLNDINYIPMESRSSNSQVTEAFNSILKKGFLGAQYEWLGIFALEHKGIELCIHKDDKAIEMIKKMGELMIDETNSRFVLNPDKSSRDLLYLFGNLSFPVANLTKLQMKNEYIRLGMEDIIEETWFCHNPIDGQPCGICNPCIYTIEEGMGYRFSEKAIKRYRKYSVFIKPYRMVKSHIKKLLI